MEHLWADFFSPNRWIKNRKANRKKNKPTFYHNHTHFFFVAKHYFFYFVAENFLWRENFMLVKLFMHVCCDFFSQHTQLFWKWCSTNKKTTKNNVFMTLFACETCCKTLVFPEEETLRWWTHGVCLSSDVFFDSRFFFRVSRKKNSRKEIEKR